MTLCNFMARNNQVGDLNSIYNFLVCLNADDGIVITGQRINIDFKTKALYAGPKETVTLVDIKPCEYWQIINNVEKDLIKAILVAKYFDALNQGGWAEDITIIG